MSIFIRALRIIVSGWFWENEESLAAFLVVFAVGGLWSELVGLGLHRFFGGWGTEPPIVTGFMATAFFVLGVALLVLPYLIVRDSWRAFRAAWQRAGEQP